MYRHKWEIGFMIFSKFSKILSLKKTLTSKFKIATRNILLIKENNFSSSSTPSFSNSPTIQTEICWLSKLTNCMRKWVNIWKILTKVCFRCWKTKDWNHKKAKNSKKISLMKTDYRRCLKIRKVMKVEGKSCRHSKKVSID